VPVLNETVEAGDETLNGDCAAEHGEDQRHGYHQLFHVRVPVRKTLLFAPDLGRVPKFAIKETPPRY
jgi:hypothetical protein